MAEIAKQMTNDLSRYEQVIFQRGRVVIDGELNEIGRLVRVMEKRKIALNEHYTPRAGAPRHSFGTLTNVTIQTNATAGSGLSADQIKILPSVGGQKSYFTAYGYVVELTDEIILDTVANNTGVRNFQQIYFILEEVEVGSGDPLIKVDDLGQTAVRRQLKITPVVGAPDVDEASIHFTPEEPWEAGGKRTIWIANVHRDVNGGPTTAQDVVEKYRLPSEVFRWSDRFFSGDVRLRPCTQGEFADTGERASAYYDDTSGEVTIFNLGVLIGMGAYDVFPGREAFTGVLVNGSFTIDTGQALVAFVPINRNLGSGGVASRENYLTGVVGTPGPGEVELKVIDAWRVGVNLNTETEQNLDLQVLICVNMGQDGLQLTSDYDTDIVFADGQRITRSVETRSPVVPQAQEVTWGHGNKFIERPVPEDAAGQPTDNTDVLPWRRTWLPANVGSLKMITQDILHQVGGGTGSAGGIVWHRRFVANVFTITVGGVTYDFSGSVETTNANWNPASNLWVADDATLHSTIKYQGSDEDQLVADRILIGEAYRAGGTSGTWTANAWNNNVTPKAVHLRRDLQGGITNETPGSNPSITDFYATRYTELNQPIRSGGSTPVIARNAHLACTRPVAYGTIFTDGNGNVTLEDGAMGFDSAVLDDISGFTRCLLTLSTASSSTNLVVLSNVHYFNNVDPNIAWNTYNQVVSATVVGVAVRQEGALFGNDGEALRYSTFRTSIAVFGGW